MRSLKLIIYCLCLLLVASATSLAKGWRGLIPLHSTRQDVEQLLGTPKDFYYDLTSETVYVDFSSGDCKGASPDSYRVPANIVTRIMVIPKSERRLDALGIDETRYKKKVDGNIKEHVFYYDEDSGESIETFAGRVESITYAPAASEAFLRCYASFEDWMSANNIACVLPATKFDEFGVLSLSEEHRRLKNVAIQLKSESPMKRAWIVVYGLEKGGRAAAVRRAKRIKYFLVKESGGFSGRVLTMATANPDAAFVEVWLSFVGQSLPQPRPLQR